jgi:uncharacterized protein (TIGR02118 family)
MIKVSIFYPNTKGRRFDRDYYLNKHIPRAIELFSAHPGYRSTSVEFGLGGGGAEEPPTYTAICHFVFDSFESFKAAFIPNRPELRGDVPNYTDIETIIQISEIALAQSSQAMGEEG